MDDQDDYLGALTLFIEEWGRVISSQKDQGGQLGEPGAPEDHGKR